MLSEFSPEGAGGPGTGMIGMYRAVTSVHEDDTQKSHVRPCLLIFQDDDIEGLGGSQPFLFHHRGEGGVGDQPWQKCLLPG